MIDNILSETVCRLCSCALFSNISCKINFMAKTGSDLCKWGLSIVKWIFERKKNIFFFFFFFAFLHLFKFIDNS